MSKLIVLVALINTAGAGVLAAVRFNTPNADFWKSHESLVLAAVIATIAIPLVQAAAVEIGERGGRKALEKQQKIEAFLTASLIDLERHAGADLKTTGVQMFVVKGWWKWKRQVRLAKVRLAPLATSGIRWGINKGVIGRCWSARGRKFEDLHAYFTPFRYYGRHAWEELDPELRYGLSYDDFQHLDGKYGTVAAVPIINANDAYIGCIAADTPLGQTLDETEALKSLEQTARLVQAVI